AKRWSPTSFTPRGFDDIQELIQVFGELFRSRGCLVAAASSVFQLPGGNLWKVNEYGDEQCGIPGNP
ncbi:MAG TPA: hypothetical protein PLM79_17190, partial [Syntrophobacteraceae bacterium]|nr:hypothetical protein [Syntrophobacteraceae bacterium]